VWVLDDFIKIQYQANPTGSIFDSNQMENVHLNMRTQTKFKGNWGFGNSVPGERNLDAIVSEKMDKYMKGEAIKIRLEIT
jgi:hypothetical protein